MFLKHLHYKIENKDAAVFFKVTFISQVATRITENPQK